MTDSTDPRWVVTYRRAGSLTHETITVHAPDMVAALRVARDQLDEAAKKWDRPKDDALAEARPYTVSFVKPSDEPLLAEAVVRLQESAAAEPLPPEGA